MNNSGGVNLELFIVRNTEELRFKDNGKQKNNTIY